MPERRKQDASETNELESPPLEVSTAESRIADGTEDTAARISKPAPKAPQKLGWLVDDFRGIAENVYEAVMIAARRARQVGMLQKQEIDRWNSAHEITEASIIAEEHSEKGVDHFHHTKPTVRGLNDLKEQRLTYLYPDRTPNPDRTPRQPE